MGVKRIGALLLAALATPAASPAIAPSCALRADEVCRCKQASLAGYFERADEVLMARLVSADEDGMDLVLRMVVVERPWKVAGAADAHLAAGDTVHYRTASSSAACGVAPEPGALYVVFAYAVEGEALLRVDTCSGTRAARTDAEGDRWDFLDVPERFVHGQLDALSGLEYLRELGPVNLHGLLEIDAFAGGHAVPLHAEPDAASEVIASVRSYDELVTREIGYEEPAAVVTDRIDGWFQVGTTSGAEAWIQSADAGAWHPYEELPVLRLAYLTSSWSGHVWPEPGAGIPLRSSRKNPTGRDEYAVNVLESAVIGGSVWFRVQILDREPCTSADTPRPELTGWVPGYGARGDPTVWYYSRGC